MHTSLLYQVQVFGLGDGKEIPRVWNRSHNNITWYKEDNILIYNITVPLLSTSSSNIASSSSVNPCNIKSMSVNTSSELK
jgi:hypothetical protein